MRQNVEDWQTVTEVRIESNKLGKWENLRLVAVK
jgi:hypothetical protein